MMMMMSMLMMMTMMMTMMMMTMVTFHKASELVQHYWTPFCPGPLCRESLGPDSESESEMSMSHHIFTSSKYEIGNTKERNKEQK